MNFEDAFPEIMKRGGFDAIVGNPPYGAEFTSVDKVYLRSKYKSMVGKFDSYGFFIERAVSLLRPQGMLGYITPPHLAYCTRSSNASKAGFGNLDRGNSSPSDESIRECYSQHDLSVSSKAI
jgi:tRNA1(Val) A37 N6-methylase TrmN6